MHIYSLYIIELICYLPVKYRFVRQQSLLYSILIKISNHSKNIARDNRFQRTIYSEAKYVFIGGPKI